MVDENKTNEKPKGTNVSNEEGNKPESTPLLKSANDSAERLEKAIAAQKAENDRTEELMHRQILGGQSEAGIQSPPKKAETDEEFTERFEKGQIDLING